MDEASDTSTGGLGEVVRLHSIRTLVVASDLGFRTRAMTVLGELGVVLFSIPIRGDREEIVALIERERPNVVVLDVTGRASTVAAVVDELRHRHPHIGVVLVSGSAEEQPRMRTLPKWGWADDLRGAVCAAYHRGNPRGLEARLRA